MLFAIINHFILPIVQSSKDNEEMTHPSAQQSPTQPPREPMEAAMPKQNGNHHNDYYQTKEHGKLWRIGNKLYNLNSFLDIHPGGSKFLLIARDRYADSTFAFEAHHHNQTKVRAMLKRYYVCDVPKESQTNFPNLTNEGTFYWVLRKRVAEYIQTVGGSGPRSFCIAYFFIMVSGWIATEIWHLRSRSIVAAILSGMFGAWLSAYGHNWIHQVKYRGWATIIDVFGFSSEQWQRDHVLEHHMFTNTPIEHHFIGIEPFVMIDPRIERTWYQKFSANIALAFLFFGLFGNHINHWTQVWTDWRLGKVPELTWRKMIFPSRLVLYIWMFGWGGGFNHFILTTGVTSLYLFSMLFGNHNTEKSWDLDTRHKLRDWGEVQVLLSSDVGTRMNLFQSTIYCWLNYHCVHHLFPHVDMTHHPNIQLILEATCREFDIPYQSMTFWAMYSEMVGTFKNPRAFGREIAHFYGL